MAEKEMEYRVELFNKWVHCVKSLMSLFLLDCYDICVEMLLRNMVCRAMVYVLASRLSVSSFSWIFFVLGGMEYPLKSMNLDYRVYFIVLFSLCCAFPSLMLKIFSSSCFLLLISIKFLSLCSGLHTHALTSALRQSKSTFFIFSSNIYHHISQISFG